MIVDCCVIFLTILFPPLGVYLMFGCGADLCINLCLTCLGYFPGHIHAFYLMVTRPNKPPKNAIYQQMPPHPQGSGHPSYGYSQGPPQGYHQAPSQGYPRPPQGYPLPPQGYNQGPTKQNTSFDRQNSQPPPPPYK